MTNEHTSLEKYTSHFLFSKGLRKVWESVDIGYVWKVSWRRKRLPHIDPKFLCIIAALPSLCWAAQPGSCGSKPYVWRWLSLRHLVPNWDWNSNCDCNSDWTLPASNSNCGTWLYNCLTPICFLWASHLHWIQPVHRSRWYSDIFDRMHLYLDWRLGRRSICYNTFWWEFHSSHIFSSDSYNNVKICLHPTPNSKTVSVVQLMWKTNRKWQDVKLALKLICFINCWRLLISSAP